MHLKKIRNILVTIVFAASMLSNEIVVFSAEPSRIDVEDLKNVEEDERTEATDSDKDIDGQEQSSDTMDETAPQEDAGLSDAIISNSGESDSQEKDETDIIGDSDTENAEDKSDFADFPEQEVITSAFEESSEGISYYNEAGEKVTGECQINGFTYLFDSNGYLMLGTQKIGEDTYLYIDKEPYIAVNYFYKAPDGKQHYFAEDGKMYYGWKTMDGKRYFFGTSDKYMLTGGTWTIDGKKYYFNQDGSQYTGWKTLAGKKYYFAEKGRAKDSQWYIDGEYYYFNEDGTLYRGWKTINSQTYYFGTADCHRLTGKWKIGSKYYYFENATGLYKGWKTINGKKYYFGTSDKHMLTGGTWIIDGKKYYFNQNGTQYIGWKTLSGKKYYFSERGQAKNSQWYIGGKYYYFNEDGTLYKGWKTIKSKRYYFGSSDRHRLVGKWKIGDDYYFFNDNGSLYRGWKTIGGNRYYFGSSRGAALTGEWKINGTTYYFKPNGQLYSNQAMCRLAQRYKSNTDWMIMVDKTTHRVGVFKKSDSGTWYRQKYWVCSVGKSSTPTLIGQYKTGYKGISFGHGYTCWYYTQIYGQVLFHSIQYYEGSMTQVLDGRLGYNISGGCVRLATANAKWIYNNIPRNTRVVIYRS